MEYAVRTPNIMGSELPEALNSLAEDGYSVQHLMPAAHSHKIIVVGVRYDDEITESTVGALWAAFEQQAQSIEQIRAYLFDSQTPAVEGDEDDAAIEE